MGSQEVQYIVIEKTWWWEHEAGLAVMKQRHHILYTHSKWLQNLKVYLQ